MRRAVKIGGVVAATVVGIFAAAVGAIYGLSSAQLRRTFPMPDAPSLQLDIAGADLVRGEHLVRAVSMCAECHGEDLGGKLFMDAGPLGQAIGTNLTSGKSGVGGSFTDEDWVLAIRHGLRNDGTSLLIMPSEAFVHYNDDDLAAIIAYVKSLPAVDRELPRTHLRVVGRALLAAGKLPFQVAEYTPALAARSTAEAAPTVEYGAYLANVGGCTGCHGPDLSGGLTGPPGSPPSSNLTRAGIGATYSQEDFMRTLREGVRPNGTPLNDAMPWRFSGRMSDEELQAIWLYLQSVPPKQTVLPQ